MFDLPFSNHSFPWLSCETGTLTELIFWLSYLIVRTIVFIPADLHWAVHHSKLLQANETIRLRLVMDHHLFNVTACEENQVVHLIILVYIL